MHLLLLLVILLRFTYTSTAYIFYFCFHKLLLFTTLITFYIYSYCLHNQYFFTYAITVRMHYYCFSKLLLPMYSASRGTQALHGLPQLLNMVAKPTLTASTPYMILVECTMLQYRSTQNTLSVAFRVCQTGSIAGKFSQAVIFT